MCTVEYYSTAKQNKYGKGQLTLKVFWKFIGRTTTTEGYENIGIYKRNWNRFTVYWGKQCPTQTTYALKWKLQYQEWITSFGVTGQKSPEYYRIMTMILVTFHNLAVRPYCSKYHTCVSSNLEKLSWYPSRSSTPLTCTISSDGSYWKVFISLTQIWTMQAPIETWLQDILVQRWKNCYESSQPHLMGLKSHSMKWNPYLECEWCQKPDAGHGPLENICRYSVR